MTREELKPCPFCGGVAEFERIGTNRVSCIVTCGDCGCMLETSETNASCGEGWNTREIEDEIKRLKREEK